MDREIERDREREGGPKGKYVKEMGMRGERLEIEREEKKEKSRKEAEARVLV